MDSCGPTAALSEVFVQDLFFPSAFLSSPCEANWEELWQTYYYSESIQLFKKPQVYAGNYTLLT